MAPIVFTFNWWGFLLADQFVTNHSIQREDEKAWHPAQDHCFISFNLSCYFSMPWLRDNKWLCSSNPWPVRVILSYIWKLSRRSGAVNKLRHSARGSGGDVLEFDLSPR